jgi:hypothetical protein
MSGELARCDLGGPRWTKDYNTHFSWCLGVPWSSALAEFAARRAEMETCGANRQAFCQQYATTAVSQQQANVGFNCRLTGAAWQADAAAHQGWCLAQPSLHYPRRETEARQQALRRCLELLNYWNQQNARQAQGVRSARIFNCVPGGAPIHVWTLGSDGSADSHGPLAAGAPCDAGDPFVKQLTPGVLYRFVAVEPQMAQCGGRNDPNYVTCIRDEFFLRGDDSGPEVTLYVPRLP